MDSMELDFKATQKWDQKTLGGNNVVLLERVFSIEEMTGVKCGGLKFHVKLKTFPSTKKVLLINQAILEIKAIEGMETLVNGMVVIKICYNSLEFLIYREHISQYNL